MVVNVSDWSRRRLLSAAGVTLTMGGCTTVLDLDEPGERTEGKGTAGAVDTPASTSPSPNGSVGQGPYARVYEETIGSVVTVRVFGGGRDGTGSGFVARDGTVVTNHHVVDGAGSVELAFGEGEWRSAEVLGTDVYSDLAALSVDDRPDYATSLALLRADPPIGTRVMALGNPFQLESSASAGIVSGVDRSLAGPNGFPIPDTIQTDAAVNPGNSGGPLVTLDGDVAGVISAGGGENIGFAISAPLARRVVPELAESGSYDHSYVGIRLLTVTPAVAEANDLPLEEPRGILVVDVVDGTPADGVLQGSPDSTFVRGSEVPVGGDVVLSIDGTPTPTLEQFTSHVALETSPGETVVLEVLRSGRRRTVDLTLGERPTP